MAITHFGIYQFIFISKELFILSNNLLLTMKLPVWKPHKYHNINMLDVESVPGEPSDSFPPNIHMGGGGKGGGVRKDKRS